jgi:predicted ATPase
MDSTFLTRVRIRNYKSIGECEVALGPLTFLVGPNGAGKSNFIDALRFVADSLRTTLDHALRERGGIKEVRRRSGGHPTHFELRLDFRTAAGGCGSYAFRVGAKAGGGFEVLAEDCIVGDAAAPLLGKEAFYRVRSGKVEMNIGVPPAASPDRLYLVNVSGLEQFRPVYEALSRMGFYNLNPDVIRTLQPPDAGDILARDGGNIPSVLSQLALQRPDVKARIEEYLGKVVPGVRGVDRKSLGPRETLELRQDIAGAKEAWRFFAANMSDGTLRVLGVLVALFQGAGGRRVPLVGIEEPELALHPGAFGVLRDSLRDASLATQVLVTSHSPDLLDDSSIPPESILAVSSESGSTLVAPPDAPSMSALREKLYTPGELLRLNQLVPGADGSGSSRTVQSELFTDLPAQ